MVRSIVMPIVASRWNGWDRNSFLTSSPIVFVMYLKEEELDGFNSFLQQKNSSILCHDRIRIYSYVVSEGTFFYKNFPINILRNIGIHHVRTSHFLMLDIDMWMSGSVSPFVSCREFVRTHPRASSRNQKRSENSSRRSRILPHGMEHLQRDVPGAASVVRTKLESHPQSAPSNSLFHARSDSVQQQEKVLQREEASVHTCCVSWNGEL